MHRPILLFIMLLLSVNIAAAQDATAEPEPLPEGIPDPAGYEWALVADGFDSPIGIIFNGSDIWVTDRGDDTLKRLVFTRSRSRLPGGTCDAPKQLGFTRKRSRPAGGTYMPTRDS